jgi:hypothetical protein
MKTVDEPKTLQQAIILGGHPNPAIEGHLKTGHRETA